MRIQLMPIVITLILLTLLIAPLIYFGAVITKINNTVVSNIPCNMTTSSIGCTYIANKTTFFADIDDYCYNVTMCYIYAETYITPSEFKAKYMTSNMEYNLYLSSCILLISYILLMAILCVYSYEYCNKIKDFSINICKNCSLCFTNKKNIDEYQLTEHTLNRDILEEVVIDDPSKEYSIYNSDTDESYRLEKEIDELFYRKN